MADKLLKSIKFPTLPDRYVIGDTSLSEEGAAAEAKAVGEALATKADTKGRYEDLIVGGAEQLLADGYETDKDPYLFRPTGGSADVGNREYLDKIVGGTVAWNQLYSHRYQVAGYTSRGVSVIENHNDEYVIVNGTSTDSLQMDLSIGEPSFEAIANHKYLFLAPKLPSGMASGTNVLFGPTPISGYVQKNGSFIAPAITSGRAYVYPRIIYPLAGVTFTNYKMFVNVFDLTQMFGSTIADYIYSLEQANAGAGVAWFRNYFPKDYYPYDKGTLRSVEGVSAHETVGFNQWDEEWELGYYDTSGQPVSGSSSIRGKNYIKVVPNTAYYAKGTPLYVCQYDAGKNFVGTRSDVSNGSFITGTNTRYIRFNMGGAYGNTYKNDICINLSDPTRNGEYEPYQKHTYPLDSDLELRGIPKLDASNNLYYDGDEYEPDGTVTRKYGIVDLGTLAWGKINDDTGRFYSLSLPFNAKANAGIVCARYLRNTSGGNMDDKSIAAYPTYLSNDPKCVYVRDSSYTDAATFKTAMSGVYLVYELSTPTTETADGYEQYQICDPSGTEEFVTDSIVPVGHETRYPHDLKKKIETAPDSPSSDGTYLMKRSGGKNSYMALPSTPSANGAYVLTVTVSGGSASYSWTAKE